MATSNVKEAKAEEDEEGSGGGGAEGSGGERKVTRAQNRTIPSFKKPSTCSDLESEHQREERRRRKERSNLFACSPQ
eukprot:765449-Hanusia_phi.AAC.3